VPFYKCNPNRPTKYEEEPGPGESTPYAQFRHHSSDPKLEDEFHVLRLVVHDPLPNEAHDGTAFVFQVHLQQIPPSKKHPLVRMDMGEQTLESRGSFPFDVGCGLVEKKQVLSIAAIHDEVDYIRVATLDVVVLAPHHRGQPMGELAPQKDEVEDHSRDVQSELQKCHNDDESVEDSPVGVDLLGPDKNIALGEHTIALGDVA
jgi:hypothetical protein